MKYDSICLRILLPLCNMVGMGYGQCVNVFVFSVSVVGRQNQLHFLIMCIFLVISDWMHISSNIGQWVYFYSHKYSWLLIWIQCSYYETLRLFCILFLT